MDAQLKQKWLEALRSGRYKQGTNVLRPKADEFCCLGVLCDIAAPGGWESDNSDGGFLHTGRKGFLPAEVTCVTRFPPHFEVTLTNMNDDGRSFAQIADWIEANIPAEAQS